MESLLDILSYVFWVMLAIMILVFVHEMGHFLFAKLFKMRVDRFSIGFPPKIIGKKIGETEYMIGATPLGGYVKIAGMVDESMDTDSLASEPQPWEFRSKPVWQRIVVITAGVAFNVILAFVIFTGLKMAYGEDYIPARNIESIYVAPSSLAYEMGLRTGDRIVAVGGKELDRFNEYDDPAALLSDPFTITVEREGEMLTFQGPDDIITQLSRKDGYLGISAFPSLVGGVLEQSPAAEAGLQPGDRIVAIDGEPVHFWQEMTDLIQESEGNPLTIRWERPDSMMTDAVASAEHVPSGEYVDRAGVHVMEALITPVEKEGGRYQLGVASPGPDLLAAEFGSVHRDYSLGSAIAAGVEQTWVTTKTIGTSLQRVFTGRENFRENVGGPIAIAQYTKQAAEAGGYAFWSLVAMLSITLAIMNILPVPALDGGHLMFLIYEGVTRREPSLRVRMALQQVGMIVLLAFMTFLIFNDILRL